jgi:chloramphenicol 3-O-phosphotransferase
MTGHVVLISGTSGAGKTTTCMAFAHRAEEPYLMFGMDLLAGTMFPAQYTIFGAKRHEGYGVTHYGPMCRQALAAMHEMIASAARSGQNMIVDHIMLTDPPVLQDCIWRMEDVPVLFVCLKPPRDVLEQRIKQRPMQLTPQVKAAIADAGDDALQGVAEELARATPWMYDSVYANDCYDLVIDSSSLTPDEICGRIEERLSSGPPKAFESLRRRYPRERF